MGKGVGVGGVDVVPGLFKLKSLLLRGEEKRGKQLFKTCTLKECCLSSLPRAGNVSVGELNSSKNLRNSVLGLS